MTRAELARRINHILEEYNYCYEPKYGTWVYNAEAYPFGNPYGHYECDQCGERVPDRTNYCPNCGAKMESDGE